MAATGERRDELGCSKLTSALLDCAIDPINSAHICNCTEATQARLT